MNEKYIRRRWDSPAEGDKRWTILIDTKLYDKVVELAKKEGVTIKHIVTQALEERLRREAKER